MIKADARAGTTHAMDRSRFLRFIVVGSAAATVNIVSRIAISQFVRFEVAVALAFPISMTLAFVLSRFMVFKRSSRSVWDEYLRFFVVNIVALAQVWLVSIGLTKLFFPAIGWTFHPELSAHSIAVGSPIFTSYYAHKFFTFR